MGGLRRRSPVEVLTQDNTAPASGCYLYGIVGTVVFAMFIRFRTSLIRDRFALQALALAGLVSIGGCGGGGSGGTVVPFGGVYPELASATSANTTASSASYTIAPASNRLTSVSPSVTVAPNSPSSGQITLNVSDVPLPGGTESAFSMTIDTSLLTPLANSPIGGSTLAPACGDCLVSGQAIASDGQMVRFLYLDPRAPGFTLKYSTLGLWSKPAALPAASGTEIGSVFSLGVMTRGRDLPTSGTAYYSGYFVGRYAISATTVVGLPAPGVYAVGANAQAQVNFSGAGSVSFSTLNTNIALEGPGGALAVPVAEPRLDLITGTPLTITRNATANSFSGTVTTKTPGMGLTGTLTGTFYGRPASTVPAAPPELGGTLAVGNTGGTQTMIGGFALKR